MWKRSTRTAAVVLALVAAFGTTATAQTVAGRVFSEIEKTLPGATVSLLPLTDPATPDRPLLAITTGLDGSFRLPAAAPGFYRLRLEAPGFVPVEHGLEPLLEEVQLPDAKLVRDLGLWVPGRGLRLDPPADPALLPPRTAAPGVEVDDSPTRLTLNGRPLALEERETPRAALAFAPDGESFLLGAEWSLRSFTRTGEERWRTSAPGVVWAVQVTGDGRLPVAAFSDGTIGWFRYQDGVELLAFFPHIDGRRWVLWTPSGYYDASVGGEDLIGWHVNSGLP